MFVFFLFLLAFLFILKITDLIYINIKGTLINRIFGNYIFLHFYIFLPFLPKRNYYGKMPIFHGENDGKVGNWKMGINNFR
ncbi:hypothetical protein GLOIN_2v722807 [Rhizophagus irregularis DAOM 181602=DAOM 197198]|uniref:Uncharacterized protein n=1 Tax=Rhizophagus irregularis (strain DAOM 181602 / DAOM 197198 / MUCL 43194) TaxID=747089 RepID=A0A2P4P751_RHIID|nr:hypothetical protein GLOIN_2v722807 [Rhizophagus irregularis DAOM 181602=DAOM 197198]POG61211.1 hypothetical protein GLOIN_2v722807 [Rhizophagus irregularis DAOM 181602=DAOM 197198]GET61596.1 hypothetical protein GLOIN_2v722807 [Rhizophagus irregularis DAOM 181602=DAOM 197198]|eukprot:XP_025168077.1 hypothetical protein GLOIN_2v722807 [Rhizophagus irregularis DAOM 181602=DAOM 197198]